MWWLLIARHIAPFAFVVTDQFSKRVCGLVEAVHRARIRLPLDHLPIGRTRRFSRQRRNRLRTEQLQHLPEDQHPATMLLRSVTSARR